MLVHNIVHCRRGIVERNAHNQGGEFHTLSLLQWWILRLCPFEDGHKCNLYNGHQYFAFIDLPRI